MYNRNNSNYLNAHIYRALLLELRKLEAKCDLITVEVSEVKRMISSLPPNADTLINLIERAANDMHEQSIKHREYVERCINGDGLLHIVRRTENGL